MTVYFSSSKLCYDGEILSVYCNSLFDNYLYPTERKYWPVDVWCYWGDNQALSKFSAGRWSNDIIIQNSLSPIRVVPQTIQYSWIRDWWRHNSSRYNNQFLSKYFRRWILLASSFGLLNTDLFMERQNFFFLVHIALSFTCRHTRLVPTFVLKFWCFFGNRIQYLVWKKQNIQPDWGIPSPFLNLWFLWKSSS